MQIAPFSAQHYTVSCSPYGCTIFYHIISLAPQFWGKDVIEHKILFFYKFCLKYFSFYEKFSEISSKTYNGFHAKNRYSCHILIRFEFSLKFRTPSRENPSSRRWGALCGQTDRHDATNCRFSQFCECT